MFKLMKETCSWMVFAVVCLAMGGCGLISDADEKFYRGAARAPDALEYEYLALASELNSIKPCYLIHPESLRVSGFVSAIGSQVSLLRSRCFAEVASNSGDKLICDHVRSASTLFYSGASLNSELCRQLAGLNHGQTVVGRTSYNLDVAGMVSLAGYSEGEVDAYLVSEGRFSSMEAARRFRHEQPSTYWNEVRMTFFHSEAFFDRIDHLSGYGTSTDLVKMKSVTWSPRQQRLWAPPEARTHSRRELAVPALDDGGD